MDDKFKSHIAHTLKQLRQEKGLSLDATAKRTGVSKAMLGQIERQESSPTIAKLWQIARGLESSFSAFFATEPDLCLSDNTFPDDPNMRVTTLFPYHSDTRFEMFEIELRDHHKQMSEPHAFGVIEHVIVIQGKVGVYMDGEWKTVHKGESIRFYADMEHGYKAVSKNAVFHNIVSYQ